jgi:hypothetical protein
MSPEQQILQEGTITVLPEGRLLVQNFRTRGMTMADLEVLAIERTKIALARATGVRFDGIRTELPAAGTERTDP